MLTTHLALDAAADDVWRMLTDFAGYRHWNPFITSAAGSLSVGERLDLTIRPPDGRPKRITPWVTAVEAGRYVEWLSHRGMPGIFDTRHSFTLTPMAGGARTLLQQSGTFTGALVRFAGGELEPTREGFNAMNEALGRRLAR
jgi:hypothetical protein